MTEESRALLALHLIQGIGGATIKSLLSHFGSALSIIEAPESRLIKVNGIGKTLTNLLRESGTLKQVDKVIQRCNELDIKIIDYSNPEFPARLSHAFDSPLILFMKGHPNLNEQKVISIVGTRRATPYGLEFVDQLVDELYKYQPLIVSGLAYGIDIAAHTRALKNNMSTIAVLASGPNIIYPNRHRNIANKMLKRGAVLSEYPPDDAPDPRRFPARNRIIAGLSDAIVVVEAADSGGALITARQANDYNREVFALPGNIDQRHSCGTNNLIKSHQARIITCADDIAYAMGWDIIEDKKEESYSIPESFGENEIKIYRLIRDEKEIHIDRLSWLSTIPVNKLASTLLKLEFEGFVNSLPGKKFKLTGKRIHV